MKQQVPGLLVLASCAALAGCATDPNTPVAKTVCIDAKLETDQETAYLRRKVTEQLAGYGFVLVDEGATCEVQVKYERFGGFQAETIRTGIFRIQRDGYWSQEGILSATHQGKSYVADESVNLRGYTSKQALLDDLGWKLVRPVTGWFVPVKPAPKK
jgi:hypothetical protein